MSRSVAEIAEKLHSHTRAAGLALRLLEEAGEEMPSPSYTVLIGKAQANRCIGYPRQSAADAQLAYSLTDDNYERARAASLVGLAFLETPPWPGNAGKGAVFPKGKLEQASSLFEEALGLSDGEYAAAHYYLGKTHLKIGNLQAVAGSFESYIASSNPSYIDKSREYLERIEMARALYVEVGLGVTGDSRPRDVAPADITFPVKLAAPQPRYGGMAKKLGVQGTVIVHAIIDEEGRVQKAVVLEGLHPQLDREAVETTRLWKFEPAKLNGQPVAVVFTLTIEYRLPGRLPTTSDCTPIP